MAQDMKDPGTVDMYPLPKKRGRKPTGNALTSAQRQQAYRQRLADKGGDIAELRQQVESLRYENVSLAEELDSAWLTIKQLQDEISRLRGSQ